MLDVATTTPRRTTPRLSVIVPVHGVEQYLRTCLDSIIAQTLQNLEIVVVNDCSPDDSEAIILEYRARDARVRYIAHTENLGLGGARNTGIRHATGEWITFVDSDDFVDIECYASALATIDRHDADGAVFPIVKFDDETGVEDDTSFPFNAPFGNPTLFDAGVPYFRTVGPTVCNKLFRRSDVIEHGIWFPERLKHEDEEFSFKYVAKVAPRLVHHASHRYHYRQRHGSIMQSSEASRLDLSKILVNVHGFLHAERLVERCRHDLIFKAREYLGYFAKPGMSDLLTPGFMADLRCVVEDLDLSVAELDALPPYFLSLYMTDFDAQRSLLRRALMSRSVMERDPWYRFGRLPPRRKLMFLLGRAFGAVRRASQRSGR